ncbi:sensor histidine kinase [Epilithonimonas arachidiradicis]|uniref:histidine kinase n=1 Tax=Epilithonimonas arachidiradicis TaxID=1617282 RepID=A0A420D7E2_9FLAO|nr:ATP-binding protein [Epilithonimonas arachidiradicis]RKE86591.1 two-component system phosphate regulon sensor histidine kinase PhoR [Epilithonimonas arachidiradicis]GGG63364.1 two-component sensor histidine kinase [Epilithonimonas arachidiradicis]
MRIRNSVKVNWLSIAASFTLVAVVGFVVVLFEIYTNDIYFKTKDFNYFVIFTLLLVFIINYFVLEFLFSFYSKNQIRRITNILPEDIIHDFDSDIGFKELEEKVHEMNQRNAEIDMMKEMENYRKEYIGNVSHELKTPLFSIQGYIETLRDGGVEDLNIRDKYLQRIDSSVERLLNIVKDLDMINRFESGQIALKYSTFDINLLIQEVFDLLEMEADKQSMTMLLQTTQSQLFVYADKQRISQVLINLISNAVKYANREEAQIIVSTREGIRNIHISVEDNGMGIKPENLPRIFERFYRVESSRNRKDGGSGLGLAIVKHILEAHKQGIIVESVYLSGTKFKFKLEKSPLERLRKMKQISNE